MTREEIDKLAYRFWSIHPKDIPSDPDMPDGYAGGARAWFYATEIRAAIAIIRGETLEEAARVVEARRYRWPEDIAAAIRALGAACAAVKEGK